MMPTGASDVGGSLESFGARLRRRRSKWGAFVLFAERLESTNAFASVLAKRAAPHGSVVLAASQSAGRGRWNRRWDSAPGGLYLSIVLRPAGREIASLGLLPLVCALAAAEALSRGAGIDARLHWPNDLHVDRRKIGGILCESSFTGTRLDSAVMGIGINVNQPAEGFSRDVASRATSVRALVGREVPVAELALEIVLALEAWWDRDWSGAERGLVLARFAELAIGVDGLRVRVATREGKSYLAATRGLEADGGLRVELKDGTIRTLRSDEVHLVDKWLDKRLPNDSSNDSMIRPVPEENYYAAIESYFVERRGSPLFISPGEWHLVSRWEELGIPLSVVKEGIDRVFERPKSRLKARKLGYCRQTVESAFRRFREARLGLRPRASDGDASGAGAGAAAEDAGSQLREMHERLRSAEARFRSESAGLARAIDEVARLLQSALDEVAGRASASPAPLSELEDTLAAADRRLVDEAESVVEEPIRAELRQRAASSLEPYRERMPEKVYRSALESAYRRRLRQKLDLPTLSLYAR
jgi:BirA family transcriptional regulator, biotin operon repressor / biotin---[acetyl-CoA-carboxylase] ligase